MRRPRSKLEVSTFPFLAVLLCVMGSLLLLLFIMDRRAKIAAQYRVTEELQARQTRTKAEDEARQAEWEKAKQALHQSLLDQQNQLLADADALQQNQSETAKNVALVQARHVSLELQRKEELDKIGMLQLEIESHRAGIQQAVKKESLSKAELLEAAKEVAELEHALRLLKAIKERDKETYSVVPYRGKRGDGRPPIYVECSRAGVLFHPEKKELQGIDFTPLSLRKEVERRFGPLAAQKAIEKGTPSTDEAKGPYVLFLVRPDGIDNYYRAQAALRGFQLDYGYELVDAGWVLEFAGNNHAKPSRPGIPDARIEPVFVPLPPLFPANGTTQPGPFQEGTGQPGPLKQGSSQQGTSPIAPPAGFDSTKTPGINPPSFPLQPGGNGNPLPSTTDPAALSQPPAFVPIGKPPPLFPNMGNPERPANPNAPAGSPNPDPKSAPIPGNNVSGQQPASGSPGEPGESPGNSSVKRIPPPSSEFGPKPPAAPPLSRLLGNKDFLITIDCRGDYATILPGSLTYRWSSANQKETDQAFVQSVRNLIARRQASVQPGEPPYRPLIRFQVSSEGRNTYYHAYPLLDRLGVPLERANVAE